MVRKRQRANQEASGSPQPTAQPDLLEPPSRRPVNSRGGGGWRGALAFSRSLPRSLPLRLRLSLSLSPSPSLFPSVPFFPPLNPPCPARLDTDLGSEFAHVLGQGRERGTGEEPSKIWIETETPSGGSEQRKEEEGERKPVCSSSFDSAGRRGFKSDFFFFFKGERLFPLSRSPLKPGLAQLQTPPARKRERKRDRGRGKKKKKGKKSSRRTFHICNKGPRGWREIPGTQGWSVYFELSGRARARVETLLASQTDFQERLFKNARHKDGHPRDYVC